MKRFRTEIPFTIAARCDTSLGELAALPYWQRQLAIALHDSIMSLTASHLRMLMGQWHSVVHMLPLGSRNEPTPTWLLVHLPVLLLLLLIYCRSSTIDCRGSISRARPNPVVCNLSFSLYFSRTASICSICCLVVCCDFFATVNYKFLSQLSALWCARYCLCTIDCQMEPFVR